VTPDFMLHGTDAITGMIALKTGFGPAPPDFIPIMRGSRAGYLYGTPEPLWAQTYAEHRAYGFGQVEGYVLRIDLRGLDVEVDDSVMLDGLSACAYRVKTPIEASRISLHATVPARAIGTRRSVPAE
jgi:hypothetical protein